MISVYLVLYDLELDTQDKCPKCGGWQEDWSKVYYSKKPALDFARKKEKEDKVKRVAVVYYSIEKVTKKFFKKALERGSDCLENGEVIWTSKRH